MKNYPQTYDTRDKEVKRAGLKPRSELSFITIYFLNRLGKVMLLLQNSFHI